jgi:hypothetical protein
LTSCLLGVHGIVTSDPRLFHLSAGVAGLAA